MWCGSTWLGAWSHEILDKTSGLNLVDTDAPFGFNQYVYDRYTSAPHFNHLSSRIQATDLALLRRALGRGACRDYTAVVQPGLGPGNRAPGRPAAPTSWSLR